MKSNPNPSGETRNTRTGAMSVEEMLKFRALPLREKILAVEKLADAERARRREALKALQGRGKG